MPKLIAIALPAGPAFVRELTEAWAGGDAVLPFDTRLPLPAAHALLEALRPAVLIDESGDHQVLPDSLPCAEDDALVVATSGTTGEPKGVVLSFDAVRASAEATSRRLAVDPERDTWLAMLPVAHVGGLGVVTRSLLTTTPLVFDPDDATATLTSLVPTQANRVDLSRFRAVLVGGSSDWHHRPPNVIHTYGMTETGGGIVYDGSALDGVEVRLDEQGQIVVRGPMLLRAYRDGHDPKDSDGWLATGDAGAIDDRGRLVVHGRIGDVIVSGGEKIWPAAVEAVLRSHASVADVGVAGRPDAEWGQRVTAWVVPADAASPPLLDDLRNHVRAQLPAHAAPRELVLVDHLPRTPIGKLRREVLDDLC